MRTDKELIGLLLEEFDRQYDSNYGLCMFTIRLESAGVITAKEEKIVDKILENNKPDNIIPINRYWWELGQKGAKIRKRFLKELYEKL